MGDFEIFKEDENGELVPDYRTAIQPNMPPYRLKLITSSSPTAKQVVGRAAFAKKRHNPHPSKIKLLFAQRVREAFRSYGFYLLDEASDEFKKLTLDVQEQVKKNFQDDLQRVRVLAARKIRREREFSDREVRRRQDQSRRINRGLL